MDYWEDCIAEAFEESGIEATQEQIENVAAWAASAHDYYGQAHGHDVADANLRADREAEKEKLRADLVFEQEKEICRACNGRGRVRLAFGTFVSDSECDECRGTGKVHPSQVKTSFWNSLS